MRTLQFSEPLIAARRRRLKPDAMVIVSDGEFALHHRYRDDVVLRANSDVDPASYDLWYLAGLDIEIATNGDLRRTVRWIDTVAGMRPASLRVWWLDVNMVIRVWPPSLFPPHTYYVEHPRAVECS